MLSLLAPGSFSMPEIQRLHATTAFRTALHVILLLGFVRSALSLALRRERVLGTVGIAATLTAALIGGAKAAAVMPDPTP